MSSALYGTLVIVFAFLSSIEACQPIVPTPSMTSPPPNESEDKEPLGSWRLETDVDWQTGELFKEELQAVNLEFMRFVENMGQVEIAVEKGTNSKYAVNMKSVGDSTKDCRELERAIKLSEDTFPFEQIKRCP